MLGLTTASATGCAAGAEDAGSLSVAPRTDSDAVHRTRTRQAAARGDRHLVQLDTEVLDPTRASRSFRQLGAEVEWWHEPTGLVALRGLDGAAARRLRSLGGVRSVTPDGVLGVLGAPPAVTVRGGPEQERPSSGGGHRSTRHWNLRAIGAPEAWRAGATGDPAVTVAVVDSGIDYAHRDLEGRVDLERSVSFVPSDDALVEEHFPDRHPVTDLNHHGTHVAATIASNGVVADGVTSDVTLIAVKVVGVEGDIQVSTLLRGVVHAVDAGADVINLSIGGVFSRSGNGPWVDQIRAALGYAWVNGAVVVVGAGNDAADMDAEPHLFHAMCDAGIAICVSATGPSEPMNTEHAEGEELDRPASYSNFGAAVDVAAPGGDAESVWAACSGTSLTIDTCRGRDDFAVGLTGTSMAAPHASGMAALLVAQHDGPRLWGRAVEVRNRMERATEDLGAEGHDPHYGHGRIWLPAALD